MSRDRTEVPSVGLLENELSLKVMVFLSLLSDQCNQEDHNTETSLSSTTSSQMESVFKAMVWATLLMKGLQP